MEKHKCIQTHKQLFDEFNKWKSLYKDVQAYINPYLGFFEDETPDSGLRKDEKIIRSSVVKYSHIYAAGLQWGITSPTRPWVKFTLPDDDVMQKDDVRFWLETVKNTTLEVLDRSNFYSQNHQNYLEMGCFGTGAMLIDEDPEDVIYCRTFTCGEYAIGTNHKGQPNAFARNIQMQPQQIADKFGLENCPQQVKNLVENQNVSTYLEVKHLIYPNPKYDEQKIDQEAMQFMDLYWMAGQDKDEYLHKGGYNEFPVMIARGLVSGSNVYGTGPGIWALGDGKQLQLMATDICIATELGIKPPIQAPMDILKNGGINILPAGANYYNPMGGSDGSIKPVFQVNLNVEHALAVAAQVEDSIKEHFSVKVFQRIIDMEHGVRTAREIQEISSEKMTQLGPLLERLQTEYLSQIVMRVFNIGFRAGIYPPPPPEIQGMPIKIEYSSVLSQAQQQYVITPIVDTVTNTIQMALQSQNMSVLDKIDMDEVVDQIATANGVPPSIIVSDERVAQLRLQRQQAIQMQQQAEQSQQILQGVKDLSQSSLEGNNALSALLKGGEMQ